MNRFMVFDVESIGLHGEGFAVGYVVIDGGSRVDEGCYACPPETAAGLTANRKWVSENVPKLAYNCEGPRQVRQRFWADWLRERAAGAVLVADCAWPVEARFLIACVDDSLATNEWDGPYPLHDLASILLALGKDPLVAGDRLLDEPAHDPLGDARQSARMLMESMNDR